MKKILILVSLFLCAHAVVYSQVPDQLNYQAVIRNSDGDLIVNQGVDVRVSVRDNSSSGPVLYQEVHTTTTNSYGIVNLIIGAGSIESGSFSEISWEQNSKYLEIEVDQGNGYVNMGTVQLLSVPYSLYSNAADSSMVSGMSYWSEYSESSGISDVALQSNYSDSTTVSAMSYTSNYSDSSRVSSMAYISNNASFADQAQTANLLGSGSVYSTSSDTLFVVKDHTGNVVFAVFPDGAEIIVNETAKGSVGGFAVSGRSPSKMDKDILRITADSTRIYVNDTVTTKGKVGGFAVSGRSPSKGLQSEILFVTPDSTRIYVNDTSTIKGKVGGFAVSGRSPNKGASVKYLDITEKNYFIGHSSGQKLTTGIYNNTLGYYSGYELTSGSNNAFIGYYAGRSNSTGVSNVFIGNNAGQSNSTGDNNVFLGYYAGYTNNANNNVFLGNEAGRYNSSGTNNAFIGYYAGRSNTTGTSNVYIGNSTFQSSSVANQNVAIGNGCAADVTSSVNSSIIMGDNALTGIVANNTVNNSMFVGKNAGINIGEGSGSVNNCIFLGTNSGDGVKNTHYSGVWSIVAVGNYSGSNTNGWRNVFIGDEAGMDFDGSYNTMIGFNVGQRGGSGEYNVYVGDQAALLANGSNNTYIGRTAGCWVNGDNNVFLGYNAGRAAFDNPRTESNRLRIGSANLIYGEFDTKRISLNGNVGVNRDAYGSVSLAVSPNSQNYGIYVDAGSALHAAYFSGSVYATGSYSGSDIRFKKEIHEIENPIDKITGIRGVTYFWNTDKFQDKGFTKEQQIGVIAQEVEKVLPELVSEDADGYKAVSYDKLSAVLIEAVKEQQHQIENLKKENEILKQKLDEIIKMLEVK